MTIEWYGLMDGEPRAVGRVESPFGACTVITSPVGIVSLDWDASENETEHGLALQNTDHHLGTTRGGLNEVSSEGARSVHAASSDVESALLDKAKEKAEQATAQLEEYFAGTRQRFTVPIAPLAGTEFQRAVWQYLLDIPYGETRSYGDVARAIGRAKAVRAVGQANRKNPVAIVVPCHRVIGQNGSLTGYAGSRIGLKAALLDLERGETQRSI